jgi:hypothetical protein
MTKAEMQKEIDQLRADLNHEKFWCDYWFEKFQDRKDRLNDAEIKIEELENKLKWTSLR